MDKYDEGKKTEIKLREWIFKLCLVAKIELPNHMHVKK